jgi:hypothetical protein
MTQAVLKAASPQWEELDSRHLFRFVKYGNHTVGGVLKHKVKGTPDDLNVWCEPGLIQWERVTETLRPIFTVESEPGANISLLPFIVCEICGDKGWIISGKWHPKDDEDGVGVTEPMRVLEEVNHVAGYQDGESFDGPEDGEYRVAVRRDLGDKVEEEEATADIKLVDVSGRGGGDTILKRPKEWSEELGIEIVDPDGWRDRQHPRSFLDPISRAEFEQRASYSTVRTKHLERIIKGEGDLVFDTDAEDAEDGVVASDDAANTWCTVHEAFRGTDDPQWPDCVRAKESDPRACKFVNWDERELVGTDVYAEQVREGERRRAIEREVKDSGHRHVFETGAQRDRAAGKGRFDLLMWWALPRIAVILEKGADKYDARNWERGMPMSRFIDSAARHIGQHMQGMTDEDHLGQATWNLLAAVQTEEMIARGILPEELNDLPNYDPDHFDLTKRPTT